MDIKYKVYDKNKRFIRKINKKDELQEDNFLKGVTCFVINKNGNVLIEQRVSKSKLMPGELDLCSGHVDNNETYTQAMIREYAEELHCSSKQEREKAMNEAISKLKPIKELDLKFNNKGKIRNFFIKFYALMTDNADIHMQEEEIENILWVPMKECFELIRNGKTKFPYDSRYEEIFEKVEQIYKGIGTLDNNIIR